MSIRMRNIVIALFVGVLTTLVIVFMFTLMSSISDRQNEMAGKLSKLGDTSYFGPENSNGPFLLFAVGAIMTVFTGGVIATLFSKTDGLSRAEWLDSPMVAAIIPALAICATALINWSPSTSNHIDQYGRLADPSPPIFIVFILVIYCSAIFIASAAGGLLAVMSKKNKG